MISFHPARGYVFCYLPLARQLGRLLDNSMPLYSFHAQGVDGDKALPGSIEEAAEAALEAIRQQQPDGAY